MSRAGKAMQKPQAVAQNAHAAMTHHAGAIGILDFGIECQRRMFALLGQFDGLFGRQIPGMIQILTLLVITLVVFVLWIILNSKAGYDDSLDHLTFIIVVSLVCCLHTCFNFFMLLNSMVS